MTRIRHECDIPGPGDYDRWPVRDPRDPRHPLCGAWFEFSVDELSDGWELVRTIDGTVHSCEWCASEADAERAGERWTAQGPNTWP